jgi:hypothetical protein
MAFPVDERFIAIAEADLGVKFPDSFRKKMMESNGGGDILVYKIEDDGVLEAIVYWQDHETNELVFAANDFAELKVSQ